MKKIGSLLAILAIIFISNCTRVPENNDPVIGIWSDTELAAATKTTKQRTIRQEWIFNDAYLGRYHEKQDGEIVFKTDFRWNNTDNTYHITYPGTEMEAEQVLMRKPK